MQYKGKNYKTILIRLKGDTPSSQVLSIIKGIEVDCSVEKLEEISCALKELISNSLRVHQEKKVNESIELKIQTYNQALYFELKDQGGGFDLTHLPYDINTETEGIDLSDAAFQEYREKSNYRHFGMGLLINKRTFDDFKVLFYDLDGISLQWKPESCIGTIIKMRYQLS